MSTPIINNIQNISQTTLSSKIDPGKSDSTPGRLAGTTPTDHVRSGRHLAAHTIDWFSDLDTGSKHAMSPSNRFEGKSVDEIVDIIMGHLGLKS